MKGKDYMVLLLSSTSEKSKRNRNNKHVNKEKAPCNQYLVCKVDSCGSLKRYVYYQTKPYYDEGEGLHGALAFLHLRKK